MSPKFLILLLGSTRILDPFATPEVFSASELLLNDTWFKAAIMERYCSFNSGYLMSTSVSLGTNQKIERPLVLC